uniref:Fe2OG dioxygenase domain-containing protein n=1 Tax=Eutreptiella gymnastica TaxID=73025 RepID=A0A7S1NTW7_9EUGL
MGDLALPDIINPQERGPQEVQQGEREATPDEESNKEEADHTNANQHDQQAPSQHEEEVDPSRQLFSTPNRQHNNQEGDTPSEEGGNKSATTPPAENSQLPLNQEAHMQGFTLPLPLSKPIMFTSPTEYVRYADEKKVDKGPPIQTFTYLYSSSEHHDKPGKLLVNSYTKLLPTQAQEVLWNIEPWNLHVGGDELLNAFKVPEMRGDNLSSYHYAPYMARPHENLVALFKEHHSFFLQPPRFNQVPHGWGKDVLTETSWVEAVVKAIEDVVRTTHIKPKGWIVFELGDPNIKACDLLGSQNHVKFRILRKHVTTVQRFTRVAPLVPRWHDSKVRVANMLVQSTPFVAILLKPFANETGNALPIAPQDHALAAGFPKRRFLESMEVSESMPESHLRFDIHPSLLSQERKLTTRDFYQFVNGFFTPDGQNVDWKTENAVYPFENALLTTFPQRNPRAMVQNGGYIRYDYKLPTIIADPLMKAVTSSQMFLSGKVFAMDMSRFSAANSYFVQPTRETFTAHEGEWTPSEVLTAVLGHIPGGQSKAKLLGSTIRTTSSVSFIIDLSDLAADDNLSQEQTFSRHMFFQVGLLVYRTTNATLVRHTQRTPTWSLLPTRPATIITQPAKEQNAPHLVYLQCPESLSTREVKTTAALIGKFEKFAYHSSLGQCTVLYSVTYSNTDSVALAHKLIIEDVVFLPNVDLPHRKKELLILNTELHEADQELEAIIHAGALLGSRDTILKLQELERRIIDVVEKLSIHEWHVEEPTSVPVPSSFPCVPAIKASRNRADRALCLTNPHAQPRDSRYMMSPSKYKPTDKALQLVADMENMVHVEAPEGLEWVPNFLTEAEESFLLAWADTLTWDSDVPTRDTIQFGFKFNYNTHELEKGRPWPKELDGLVDKLKPYMKGKPINQCIANRTVPPQGFGRHKDDDKFDDPIAIVSTNGGANIVFIHRDGTRYHVARSQRLSLLVMSGESRYQYVHAIPEGVDDPWDGKLIPRRMRISWTVRSVMDVSMFDD